ncbi:MAG: Phosphoribosylformylglycinamidine synthase [Sodalis sp.]|nr:MAG: Phosphoribosylformylglycinamidine synthase [Sodalis sp.]
MATTAWSNQRRRQADCSGRTSVKYGLGDGAASSMASWQSDADLDFTSVQQDNPAMERRCQEVINHC